MQQIVFGNFIDVYIHHHFSAIFVDTLYKLADEADVFGRISDRQAVGSRIRNNDRLWTPDRRRYRLLDQAFYFFRVAVGQIEGPQHKLLILRTTRLVGNDDGAATQLLKKQSFLQKDVVKRLGSADVTQIDIEDSTVKAVTISLHQCKCLIHRTSWPEHFNACRLQQLCQVDRNKVFIFDYQEAASM